MSPVVHVVAAGEIGGAERMLADLAQDRTRPHTIALFTPNPALRRLFVEAGIAVDDRGPVREGPLPFLASTLGGSDVRWLAEVLRARGAAIVHLHTFASQVLGTRAALEVGARIVRTEHSTRVYEDPSCWPFARWSLPRAHAVACISAHIEEVVRTRAPAALERSRLHVVPNGVDIDHFAPRTAGGDSQPGRPIRFAAVGRLDPRKGLDLALEALALVPEAELAIIGEGEARRDLERLASRLGLGDRVRFAGHATDVRAALAAADVVLSSARTEGLGVALIEAMAMERPVVAVPVGGIVEVVRDGETGWLANVRSASALAQAMREAARATPEERRRRGVAGRRRAVDVFSVHAMRRGYERIYATLGP